MNSDTPGGDAPLVFLDCLANPARPPITTRVLVVAAHPDDESIGLGAQLRRFIDVTILHVTDGSPRNPADATAAGFTTALEYAQARRRELIAAIALGGVPVEQAKELCIRDQDASLDLAGLARNLAEMLDRSRPDVVITHPYEGGHPDHDASAFGVHAACAMLDAPPVIVEMTSYHLREGTMVTSEFLGSPESKVATLALGRGEAAIKQQMFDCFETQRHVLKSFPIHTERFRLAPRYDFTLAPHAGPLFYEQFDFGMIGERFRALAWEALVRLRIGGPI